MRSANTRQAVIGLGAMAIVLAVIVILALRGADERGLRVDVLSTRRAEPGEQVDVTISVRDNFGFVKRVEVDFGDGNRAEPVVQDPSGECRTDFARTENFDFTHVYEGRAPYTVKATVTSGGCGSEDEKVEAIRTIDVKPLRRQ